MPDREVSTMRELIFYQYAKIIARSAFSVSDGVEAKKRHYGFIKKTFRELKSGKKSWSEIIREDKQLVESEKVCAYCGSKEDLQWEHLVPLSVSILERCDKCERIHGIHNQVWACRTCNLQKGTKGLYEFFHDKFPGDNKFYDRIPPLLEKKYLKTIYCCHECAGTLNSVDLNGDGRIDVLDIDAVLRLSIRGHK